MTVGGVLEGKPDDQLNRIELSPFGLHWPDLDEDLSLRGILADEPTIYSRLDPWVGRGPQTREGLLLQPRKPRRGWTRAESSLPKTPGTLLLRWWAEGYDGQNGFAIGDGEIHTDPEIQDRYDVEAAFRVLENELIPLYYGRDERVVPLGWMGHVRHAMRNLAWKFNADRMVMDYVRGTYLPAAAGATSQL